MDHHEGVDEDEAEDNDDVQKPLLGKRRGNEAARADGRSSGSKRGNGDRSKADKSKSDSRRDSKGGSKGAEEWDDKPREEEEGKESKGGVEEGAAADAPTGAVGDDESQLELKRR